MLQKLLFTALALSLLLPSAAHAQSDGQTTETLIDFGTTSLFPRNTYGLTFSGDPRQSESKFTLRFQAYGTVSGCAKMIKGRIPKEQKDMYKEAKKDGFKVEYLGKRVKVAILDTELKVNRKKHPDRYGLHDCNIKQLISYSEIKMDRDELLDRGTNKLKLDSIKYGDFGEHELDVNEDRLIMKVKSSGGEYWPTFWFFPSNSITLRAPGAKQGENVTEMIREFGISHGLIPMEEVLDGYKLPHSAVDYVLFTDPQGRFINQISKDEPTVFIGKITPSRTIYGVDGPREVNYSIDVKASYAVQPQPE